MKSLFSLCLFLVVFTSCTNTTNSDDFIQKANGRYLFNADEIIEIYFKEQVLFVKWRGKNNLKPLKISDSVFYFKEMNEKMHFVSLPKMHIELAPKREHEGRKYHFRKLAPGEVLPKEYLENGQFTEALNAYLKLQKADPEAPTIDEYNLNQLGYTFVRENKFKKAIDIFKINVALYPKSSNVYDSLGEAFLLDKDTINAVKYYEKSLDLDYNNEHAERILRKIHKK